MKKRSIKTLLLILLMFVIFVTAAAADEGKNVFETYDDALGGFFGPIAGSGLSYQHWFGNFGIQTAAGLFYYPEEAGAYATSPNYTANPVDVDEFTYNIGVEAQYMLYDDSYSDWFDGSLYLFLGGTHSGAFRTTYTYEEVLIPTEGEPYKEFQNTGVSDPRFVPGMSAGFGFGFELVFFDHFSIPIEIGLSGTWEYGSWVPVDAGLYPQAGFRYRF